MKIKHIIDLGLCSLLLMSVGSLNGYQAKASNSDKLLNIIKHSKKSHHHFYLNSNRFNHLYMFNDHDLSKLKNHDTVAVKKYRHLQGTSVKILKRQTLDRITFYKVYIPRFNSINWVTKHNVSSNPRHIHSSSITSILHSLGYVYNSSNHQILSQMYHTSVTNINHDRRNNYLPPLKINHQLNHLATLRSRQIMTNFNHYTRNHQLIYELDARTHHYDLGSHSGENIANAELGKVDMIGDPDKYNNHNGIDMANMDNDAMLNHDQTHHNGHRKNILSPHFTKLGIGASYDKKSNRYYLSEEFSN